MPVASLPGKYGIGTFGKESYDFVDMLSESGQSFWQILPLGPTSYGDSPYQSFSTFAGNPYFIDLAELVEDGYLERSDFENYYWGNDEHKVDYGALYASRKLVFEKARQKFFARKPDDFDSFCSDWFSCIIARLERSKIQRKTLTSATLPP